MPYTMINYLNLKVFIRIPAVAIYLLLGGCHTESRHNELVTSLCTRGALATTKGIDFLPTPSYRSDIGNCHLAISTSNKVAQKWFDQGLNHLHGFWHVEAYRAFREVIKADSTCAMGYWGLAMCQPGFGGNQNNFWKNAIAKANSLKNATSAFEKDLITASYVLVNSGLQAAQAPFRNLYKSYPSQPEAIAFAAIMLRQHENEVTQQEVKQLLEDALQRFPSHIGLLHYYVHVLELRPEFRDAQHAANLITKLAPNAPHLTHMPGHLYFLAGEYDKAVATFKKAFHQEYNYHKSENIPFSANQNYLHNLHFLAISEAERGNYQAALDAANQFANITLDSRIPNEGAAQMLLYKGRILPALVHIRFRAWQQAEDKLSFWLNSLDVPLKNPLVRTYLRAMRAYVQGMKALHEGAKSEVAITKGVELTMLMQEFEKEAMAYQQTPEFKSINETYDILNMARYELAGWIDNLDVSKPFNGAAWQEAIKLQNLIKYDEPPRLMYPIEESLTRLHLYRKDKQAALQAQKAALKRRPNSKLILRLL